MSSKPLHPIYPHLPEKGGYRVSEAARAIGVSRQFLYKEIRDGYLACQCYARRGLVIPRQSLYDYIERHQYDPHA